MFRKKHAVICVVTIYAILFVLFFRTKKERKPYHLYEHCDESPCVRFCCDDQKFCKDDYINQNFNKSLIAADDDDDDYYQWNSSQLLSPAYGNPECTGSFGDVIQFGSNTTWSFYRVSKAISTFFIIWFLWNLFRMEILLLMDLYINMIDIVWKNQRLMKLSVGNYSFAKPMKDSTKFSTLFVCWTLLVTFVKSL